MSTASFAELGLSAATLSAISLAGYTTPTPIQVEGIPVLARGGDVILQAQTGTGKTAAFALPIVDRLQRAPGHVEALVLTPTRELAKQVGEEFARFGRPRDIAAAAIYGGASFETQYRALAGAQIVVATPGRLLDLVRRKRLSLRHVRIFGLDEADEMLSLGFEEDVMEIVRMLPNERQSFLCSATVTDQVLRLASTFTRSPVSVNVSTDAVAAQTVDHVYFRVPAVSKPGAIIRLIAARRLRGAIIFANTRAETFRIHEALEQEGFSAGVLNGDLSQTEREQALDRMRADHIRFLVATDVAARGIDISGLPAVVNYDMPDSPEPYIHRTGRTGRAGQIGVAYSLVTPADIGVFHALTRHYDLSLREETLPGREDLRRVRADSALDDALDGLDAEGTLSYGGLLPLAQRLRERDDGARIVAKLLAWYREGAASRVASSRRDDVVGMALPVLSLASDTATGGVTSAPRPPRPTADVAPRDPREAGSAADTDEKEDAAVARVSGPISPEAIYAWLDANGSRRRGRWRSAFAIASAFGVDSSIVAGLAAQHPGLEKSLKAGDRDIWRVRRSAGDAPGGTEAPSARPEPDSASAPTANSEPQAARAKEERPREPRGERGERSRRERGRRGERRTESPAGDPPARKTTPKPSRGEGAGEGRPRRDRNGRRERSEGERLALRASKAAPDEPAGRAPLPAAMLASRVPAGFTSLAVNVGSDLVADGEALARELADIAGIERDSDLGTVRMEPQRTLIEVREDWVSAFRQTLHGADFHGHRIAVQLPR